ncbi:MAG: hypothetical protein IKZ05_06575, partial [Clostridia bacterium]|nr:hypothetical protein [Clostridia bacterium]
ITNEGIIIRTATDVIPTYKRSTTGVRVMKLNEGAVVALREVELVGGGVHIPERREEGMSLAFERILVGVYTYVELILRIVLAVDDSAGRLVAAVHRAGVVCLADLCGNDRADHFAVLAEHIGIKTVFFIYGEHTGIGNAVPYLSDVVKVNVELDLRAYEGILTGNLCENVAFFVGHILIDVVADRVCRVNVGEVEKICLFDNVKDIYLLALSLVKSDLFAGFAVVKLEGNESLVTVVTAREVGGTFCGDACTVNVFKVGAAAHEGVGLTACINEVPFREVEGAPVGFVHRDSGRARFGFADHFVFTVAYAGYGRGNIGVFLGVGVFEGVVIIVAPIIACRKRYGDCRKAHQRAKQK